MVAACVAELGVDQPSLQAYLLTWLTGARRGGRHCGPGSLIIARDQPRMRHRDGRVEHGLRTGASGRVDCGLDVPRRRAGLRFEERQRGAGIISAGPAELRPLKIEANGINVITDAERKGRPRDLFWPWVAATVSVLGLSY